MRLTDFRQRALLTVSVALIGGAAAAEVQAADAAYPARTVRVVVPYAAGGGADVLCRILFAKVSADLAQQFLIDNRGGAAGTIGPAIVAKAPADGYTILYDATAHSVNPALFASLPYDARKDFQPVFLAARLPLLMVVHPSVKVKTVADVIALAKATPTGLDWASSGNGGIQHLALELLRKMAGIKLNHVPYKSGAPAIADLLGGHIKFYFSNTAASSGYVKSGAMHAIAQTSRQRIAEFPDLPPVADTLPGFEAYEWNGVFVPSSTPHAVIVRLNSALNAAIQDPKVKERLASLSVETRTNTPQEFGAFVAEETSKWAKVVREANIKLE
jgi:tripartite-type tricarboxylate transporter receptor subunit TctC